MEIDLCIIVCLKLFTIVTLQAVIRSLRCSVTHRRWSYVQDALQSCASLPEERRASQKVSLVYMDTSAHDPKHDGTQFVNLAITQILDKYHSMIRISLWDFLSSSRVVRTCHTNTLNYGLQKMTNDFMFSCGRNMAGSALIDQRYTYMRL